MSNDDFQPWQWLLRDRLRFLIILESAAAGFLVALALAYALGTEDADADIRFNPLGVAILASFGGAASGLFLSGWFGRPGKAGWVFATLAAFLSPSLAGAIIGTFIAPLAGTAFGAGMALLSFVHVQSFAVWLFCLLAMHLQIRYLRQRDPSHRKTSPDVFE